MNAHVNTEELIKLLNENHDKVVQQAEENEKKADTALGEIKARLLEIEQKAARRGAGDEPQHKTLGEAVVASEQFKAYMAGGAVGKVKIETKAVSTITSASDSAGGTVARDRRPEIVALPQRKFVVRDLVAPGTTESNLVEYPRHVARQLNAAVVAEGAAKPQSDEQFELRQAPVRTIAHWMRLSRQVLDDSSQLMSFIDGELRYGLNLVEEQEMLLGDGTGQHLFGIIPQSTPFAAPFVVQDGTELDQLLLSIAQVEAALYPADAIVVNPIDWRRMQAIKDADGRYIGSGPFVAQVPVAWNLPIVTSLAIAPNNFLVGAFRYGAQVFDRLEPEVLISNEDNDNFTKNLVTVRGEERLAFAVKRPDAFVYGQLS